MKVLSSLFRTRWRVGLIGALIGVYLLIYPFRKGLFVSHHVFSFEGPLYGAMIYVSLSFAVFAALYARQFLFADEEALGIHIGSRPEYERTRHKGPLAVQWLNQPILHGLAPFAVLLLPLCYLVSVAVAVSRHSATLSFMIWLTYAFLFLMAYRLSREPGGGAMLAGAMALSGCVVVIFGFMNYFGDASLWGWIQYIGLNGTPGDTYLRAVEYGASGLRLTSVFQYANSYAGFLIGLFLLLAGVALHARNRRVAVAASLPVVPVLLSMLLTLSRGAYMIFPVAALLFLSLLTIHRQLMFIGLTAAAFALALPLYGPIHDIGLKAVTEGFSPALALRGWGLLVAGSIVFAALSYLMFRYASPRLEAFAARRVRFRSGRLFLPAAGLAIFVAGLFLLLGNAKRIAEWLPASLGERLSSIGLDQHSVLERATFYSDILKMFADYPLIGAGGGAWTYLYEKYQNNPYTSNDPHSFYLQFLLETGVIGFLTFAAFFLAVVTGAVRRAARGRFEWNSAAAACFGMLIGLAVHSAIDFDLNYMLLGSFFILCLGVLAGSPAVPGAEPPRMDGLLSKEDGIKIGNRRDKSLRRKAGRPLSGRDGAPARSSSLRAAFSVSAAVIGLIGALTLFAAAQERLSAHNAFSAILREVREAAGNAVNFETVDAKLQDAIKKAPRHPVYLTQRAALLIQMYGQTRNEHFASQARAILDRLQKSEPYRKDAFALGLDLLLKEGKREQALALAELGLARYPWDMSLYEMVFVLHDELAADAASRGDNAERRRHIEAILEWRNVIEARIKRLASLPEGQQQGRPFEWTDRMKEILARTGY